MRASLVRSVRPRPRPVLLAAFLAGLALLAACSSGSSPAKPAGAVTSSLVTSLAAVGGSTWAVLPMGGSAAAEDSFWELFTRPAASTTWTLVTPPGVADNGGLVAATPALGQQMGVAIRPSQGLLFSPLAVTSDNGKTWGTGLLDAAVADVPDAIASDNGGMLALLNDGAIDQITVSGTPWRRLAAPGAIAATSAGQSCSITGLTAVTYSPSGAPLAAASCGQQGVAGIFAYSAGTWEAAGPAMTGKLASEQIQVLRLTGAPSGDIALLRAGTGSTATLLAAWTSDGAHWTVSSPFTVGTGTVSASGTGPGGTAWVLLTGDHAEAISGPGTSWHALPAPPPGTTALAVGPGGSFDALAVSGGGTTLTVFQLTSAGAWSKTQVITVPIQLGSSS
jgi:hypothetical protein